MSNSEIIEIEVGIISTIKLLDWLEQLMVIRRTIIWIGSPGPGWIGTNSQTFLLWKAWKMRQHSVRVGYIHFYHFTLNIFHFSLSSTYHIQNWVGSHFADNVCVRLVVVVFSIPSISPSIYLILTSDGLAGTSLSALVSLDALLLLRASSFICRLTAIAL